MLEPALSLPIGVRATKVLVVRASFCKELQQALCLQNFHSGKMIIRVTCTNCLSMQRIQDYG